MSKTGLFALLTLMLILGSFAVIAAEIPIGAQTVIEGEESSINLTNYPAAWVEAYAGNISQLTIFGRSQTKHWQGYYGEVTGIITLDDASNWTLYDWPNDEPKGEIYATVSNASPSWTTVQCFNYTNGVNGTGLGNVTQWENYYNFVYNDVDGLDETFNMTSHPQFDVGEFTIQANNCPSTYTHVNDEFQEDKFVEVLLADSDGALIFTTIIENDNTANNTDPLGYDGRTHDFQMLVAEDGTSRGCVGAVCDVRNQDVTRYNFYLDLQ